MINPFLSFTIIVRHSVALGAGAWAPISQGCPLKETVYLTAYKTPRPLSSPSWPSLLISSLQRLPERTGRGPGLGFPSAKVKNLPYLSWVPLPPRTSGVIPGRQAAWGWVGRGSSREWESLKPWGEDSRSIVKLPGGQGGLWAAGAHPCLACPALLATGAPGYSLCLLSPADTWGGLPTRAPFISSPLKKPLARYTSKPLLEPTSHVGKRLLPPCPHLRWLSSLHLRPPQFLQDQWPQFLFTQIPSWLSLSTKAFPSPGQTFTSATCSFPFPAMPSWPRGCPAPITDSSEPPPQQAPWCVSLGLLLSTPTEHHLTQFIPSPLGD